MLKLLGLLPAGARPARAARQGARERGRRLLRAAHRQAGDRRRVRLGSAGKIALAHELTHALEDQHFGIERRPANSFERDRSTADSAFKEGTATIAMVDYVVLDQTGAPRSRRACGRER